MLLIFQLWTSEAQADDTGTSPDGES